jgi:hypothetical protein
VSTLFIFSTWKEREAQDFPTLFWDWEPVLERLSNYHSMAVCVFQLLKAVVFGRFWNGSVNVYMCKSTSKLIVSLNKPSSYWLFTNSQTEIFIQQVSSNLRMNYTSYVPCRTFSNMYSLFSYPTVQEVSVSLFCQYLINTHTVGSYPAESMSALQLTIAGNKTHTKPNQTKPNQTEHSERPM